MPYLNVDLAYFTHRKTVRLVGLLGRGAEVLPIKLWSYCGMHHAESGKLSSYGPEEIETAAGWWGEKGRAVEAMLIVGFLEKDSDNNFQVHDWLEHAGHLAAFKKRAKTAAKRRWNKYASSIAKHKSKHAKTGKAKLGKVGSESSESLDLERGSGGESLGTAPPEWVDSDLWQKFREHRKALKKPLTEFAEVLAFSRLAKFRNNGGDPNEIIKRSIENGWQGLFPERSERKSKAEDLKEKTRDALTRPLPK